MSTWPRFVVVNCPRDGMRFWWPPSTAGRTIPCPGCRAPFAVPQETFGEPEWHGCLCVGTVSTYLERCGLRPSDRKSRLLACAVCYHSWDQLDAACRGALAVAERFADGHASDAERATAEAAIDQHLRGLRSDRVTHAEHWGMHLRRLLQPTVPSGSLLSPPPWHRPAEELALFREGVGNPFRASAIDPSWLIWNGGTVARLAGSIYAERSFDQMPILGDALEDAGCSDTDLLAHCGNGGPHVRGCWALDLLLGRS